MTTYVLLNVGYADGRAGDFLGAFLQSYDPEFEGGRGAIGWTREIRKAMTFASMEAIENLRSLVPVNRPVRSDGQPNRPLMAYNLEVVKAPPAR